MSLAVFSAFIIGLAIGLFLALFMIADLVERKQEEILQIIDRLIIYHRLFTNAETEDYHKGVVDGLKKSRDIIEKGGEE